MKNERSLVPALGALICAALMATAADGQSIEWTPAAKMLTGKGGQVCGLVGGKVLCVGGTYWADGVKHWTGDLDIYDPKSDTWSRGPAMPIALSYGTGQSIGNRLYVVSGSDGERDYNNTIIVLRVGKRYDYIRGPELPAPRIFSASAAIGTKLYVIGGAPDERLQGKIHNDILILDTANPGAGWKASRRMPGQVLTLMAAAAVGSRIYIFGGYGPGDEGLRNYSSAFVYDTTHDRWRRLPPLPYAVRCMDAIAVRGQVYLLGGYITWPAAMGREEGFTDNILRFDPQSETYSPAGKLPLPNCGCSPLLLPDGRIFVNGGEDQKQHRTDLCAVGTVRG